MSAQVRSLLVESLLIDSLAPLAMLGDKTLLVYIMTIIHFIVWTCRGMTLVPRHKVHSNA